MKMIMYCILKSLEKDISNLVDNLLQTHTLRSQEVLFSFFCIKYKSLSLQFNPIPLVPSLMGKKCS